MGDSDVQRIDVVRLLERSLDLMDRAYIEKWIAELGLQAEWDSALGRSRPDSPDR